jgi:hypothetical protein
MKWTTKRSAAVLLATGTAAQFVPAPTDLITKEGYAGINVRYKEVPTGICELDPDVKSYSGYADVDEDQHIFWWFFESRNQNASEAPLTVWINGGPGSYLSSNLSVLLALDICLSSTFASSFPFPLFALLLALISTF